MKNSRQTPRMSPRVERDKVEWYREHFKTPNAGAEYVLHVFPAIYHFGLNFLEKLGEKRIACLKDLMQPIDLNPNIAGRNIFIPLSNEMDPHDACRQHGIVLDDLKAKLQALSDVERIVLEIWLKSM